MFLRNVNYFANYCYLYNMMTWITLPWLLSCRSYLEMEGTSIPVPLLPTTALAWTTSLYSPLFFWWLDPLSSYWLIWITVWDRYSTHKTVLLHLTIPGSVFKSFWTHRIKDSCFPFWCVYSAHLHWFCCYYCHPCSQVLFTLSTFSFTAVPSECLSYFLSVHWDLSPLSSDPSF